MEHYFHIFAFFVGFTIVGLASRQIGQFFARFRLPLITGFLFTGIITGPFVLHLITLEAVENLHFIDEFSLAFIAFAAGSELYFQELKSRLKSIAWITIGLVAATFALGTTAVLMLADFIPFMQSMPPASRLGVALLVGAILVARSPSAAIAIINELRAKGPFTQTVLGVTIIMDVVVITLFAVNSSIADALLTNLSFNLGFVGLLMVELLLALLLGYITGQIVKLFLSLTIHKLLKTGLILLTGYGVFVLSTYLRYLSHEQLSFEILIEPLLVCMIGSFLVTNFTQYRAEFRTIIRDSGLPIYVAFFTLTGASLELDVLTQTWPIALALFFVRLTGIFIGSFGGGLIAGAPMAHNRVRWLAFVTQAGVAIGLAKQVAVEFPDWGLSFATMIISLVVLNEMIGPILLKWTINHLGEAHTRAEGSEFGGERSALIFGLEGESMALAHQLSAHGWQVKVATRKANFVLGFLEEVYETDIEIQPISELTLKALQQLEAERAEAIVAMLHNDDENYRICELAYEHYGTETLVTRLNNPANLERFRELGVLIVDPRTAMVGLLDHMVRSPASASLLLGTSASQDIVDVVVRDPSLHGVAVRDVRLPPDTLILSIYRNGQPLITHGYTRFQVGDQVTVVGSTKSLDEVALRFSQS